jgi:hypothetical protein
VLPDQQQFGELFAATSDKLGNWCAASLTLSRVHDGLLVVAGG